MVIYVLIWIISEYTASLLLVIIPIITIAILMLSLLFELIEPSKVPKVYYYYLLTIIIAPIIVGIFFFSINGFDMAWLE